jgi:hypothetical protein
VSPHRVVEAVDISGNGTFGAVAGGELVRQTSSDFSVLKDVSTIALS